MLAICWQYLTGRSVATEPNDRQKAEWPPHPDRVFQALVAAWGETGQKTEQKSALEWLCAQTAPKITALENAIPCAIPKVFVPVNDSNAQTWKNAKKQVFAQPMRELNIGRDRQPRYFPATFVGDSICALVWPDADPLPHEAALKILCASVTNIGHSSSLVRMWLADFAPEPIWAPAEATERQRDISLRVPGPGRLDALIAAHAGGGEGWERPPTAGWQGYVRQSSHVSITQHSVFDPRLMVLRRVGGNRFGLETTLALTDALRKTLIAAAETTGSAIAKGIFSGHSPDGSSATTPHAAYLPLAFVGAEHADGHLLGLAIALPNGLARADEDSCYAALAAAIDPETNSVRITCGAAGAVDLAYEDRDIVVRPYALRPGIWSAAARVWATVTPVALDRFPKDDNAAADAIIVACTRIGLPPPCEVRILPVSRHTGAPACREMPALTRKADGAKRWHVHAELIFSEPVAGPVLLGAGRFRGYGICKPMQGNLPE